MVNVVIFPLQPSSAFLSAFVDRGEHSTSEAARAAILATALAPAPLSRKEPLGELSRRTTVSLDAQTHQLLGFVFLSSELSSLTSLCAEAAASSERRTLTHTLLGMSGGEREGLLLDTLHTLGVVPVRESYLLSRRASRMEEALRAAESVFSPAAVASLRRELDEVRSRLSGK
jgi:hypothetical protein